VLAMCLVQFSNLIGTFISWYWIVSDHSANAFMLMLCNFTYSRLPPAASFFSVTFSLISPPFTCRFLWEILFLPA
jgi:hypothetical protein